jgi:putative phosphoesterase
MKKIGVISDTHGLVRPEALQALHGTELILHAGDIGGAEVIEALERLAPVRAIRGNNDTGAWAERFPEILDLRIEDAAIHIVHSANDLNEEDARKADVVVSGHSHRPSIERRDRVLYLNPGSAGPRRFKLPIAVAILTVDRASVRARLIELKV